MTSTYELPLTLSRFLDLPETKPATEYINGRLIQKPMPQGEHSLIQTRLSQAINLLGVPNKSVMALCELRCTFEGRSIVPDVAVFVWSRIPKTESGKISNRFEICPDWIVEILSPEQAPNQVIEKILFSMERGATLGWFIDPQDESVMVFQPGSLFIARGDNLLPVIPVLSSWQIPARELFEWLKL
ncbi:Uma2 family endonuclease [Merismopedia glauca]|uniref:Putative restriction endonuclease domain-containing protein n=1 Tax=Merismopedia glauca CCAP 1448/3 TaxID=1296344 RepID=A0A2T1BYH2_9CYAN|nr:Uma2 family endonuclease [Merismopedia glauca]PSB00948.1 hypothetical protein C7B64_20900 [Merismopedia glauca CCAP 1448/3]